MAVYLRRKVSLKKKRFQDDGFDLDLTWRLDITENVITMGFPSVGMESVYRNPRHDVKKFFERRHPNGYKVYNLCGESGRHYEASVFNGRVSYFPFMDHQAPPITLMGEFCKDVEDWIKAEPGHVAAIHCKAGKGRAGMMSCCYLIHSRKFETAQEAMDFYAKQRTYNCQGVTIPSQRRYVTYYQDIRDYGLPDQPTIKVKSITIATSKYMHPEKSKPYVVILSKGSEVLLETVPQPVSIAQGPYFNHPLSFCSLDMNGAKAGDTEIDLKGTPVSGDVKIVIYDEGIQKGQEVSHLWFNTGFISNNKLDLKRHEIDKAWGDKKFKIFSQEFHVSLTFEDAEMSPMDRLKEAKGATIEENGSKTEAA
ncbi:putative TPIP alpha lipid phosphatase [Planoprotostelium fungivorum]|uniref:Putative TPIP alpha lipid phosphatase n=1 Tax=Planoprotostelium fungivorum TaxID=1890364 RepID=A0A2P6NNR2_9EUKA|nr:putative TPIP alpha lipid phosphatase [Planoprotostelium fungivorum]